MDPKNHCQDLILTLSEYVDGALAAELCSELEYHLAECQNCRVVVDTLKKTINLVRVYKYPAEVPDDVRQRLFHSLSLDEFI